MAAPVVDWEYWSASTIAPTMKAVVHFPSGDVTLTDSELSGVSIDLQAFDSSAILFGKPVPSTGSLEIIDYEQHFNPTTNKELHEGVQIDLYLGLLSTDANEYLGPNLIKSVETAQWVNWEGRRFYAIPGTTTELLPRNAEFLLTFDCKMKDGTTQHVRRTVSNNIARDYEMRIGILDTNVLEATNIQLRQRFTLWQPYGVWYAQEWSYESSGSTASVDLIDGINEVLSLDDRPDAADPTTDIAALQWLNQLLSLRYKNTLTLAISLSDIFNCQLKYATYCTTQATTINNLVEALMSMLFFMPDGTLWVSDFTGAYDTEITLTDNDAESYSIQQTSAVTVDSAKVTAALPELVETKELYSYNDQHITGSEHLSANTDGIYSIDYLVGTGLTSEAIGDVYYSWTPEGVQLNSFEELSLDTTKFSAYGHGVETTDAIVQSVPGVLPYTIESNPYIQSLEWAGTLADQLQRYITLDHRTIVVSLRGGYGLWLGAKIKVNSERYNITATYVVIKLSFEYDGAVSTTLTMQRV